MKINFKEFLQSKAFKRITCGTVILLLALLIFQAGEFIGYKKAGFSYNFGERYYRFSETHGAIGKIIKIDLPNITLDGRDNIEKNIIITASTTIRIQREDLKSIDLKVGDSIMVIGLPNDKAEIEAKLIRVLPNAK